MDYAAPTRVEPCKPNADDESQKARNEKNSTYTPADEWEKLHLLLLRVACQRDHSRTTIITIILDMQFIWHNLVDIYTYIRVCVFFSSFASTRALALTAIATAMCLSVALVMFCKCD